MPDFFLDSEGDDPHKMFESQKKTAQSASQGSPEGGVAQTFEIIKSVCSAELVDTVKGVFEFHLEGKEPGVWYLDLKNNSGKKTVSSWLSIVSVSTLSPVIIYGFVKTESSSFLNSRLRNAIFHVFSEHAKTGERHVKTVFSCVVLCSSDFGTFLRHFGHVNNL